MGVSDGKSLRSISRNVTSDVKGKDLPRNVSNVSITTFHLVLKDTPGKLF